MDPSVKTAQTDTAFPYIQLATQSALKLFEVKTTADVAKTTAETINNPYNQQSMRLLTTGLLVLGGMYILRKA